jgi:hypothetical protein
MRLFVTSEQPLSCQDFLWCLSGFDQVETQLEPVPRTLFWPLGGVWAWKVPTCRLYPLSVQLLLFSPGAETLSPSGIN